MSLAQCPQGHYYDDAQFSNCPFCGIKLSVSPAKAMQAEKTAAANATDGERTIAMIEDDEITLSGLDLGDDDVTIGIYSAKYNGEPTVGWLMCTEGSEKGRDYRLHPAKNFIGRSARMDVCIYDDPRISREEHSCILYDPKQNEFFAAPGSGLTMLNGEPLLNAVLLREGDQIELGDTVLMFVPFCKGDRTWEE